MVKTPLEQFIAFVKRKLCAVRHSVQTYPWVVGGVVCVLFLLCLSVGVSCISADRSPHLPNSPSSSVIVQRLGKFDALQQLLSSSVAEGGSVVTQEANHTVQRVVANLLITTDAVQELPAATSAPAMFSLFDGFDDGTSDAQSGSVENAEGNEVSDAQSESDENAESDEVSNAPGEAGNESSTESSNTEIDLNSLTNAIQTMESSGYEVGCFFINLDTGVGVAYNLDTRIYGASSFKGIYAAYLSEHLADGDAGLSASARSLMDASVRYSDNTAFSTLRNSYDGAGFASWIELCGVDSDIVHDTHFPRYSARESALLWLHTYRYLESGSDAANHLREIYTQTNTSFIREGVDEVLAGKSAVVMNKAGWIASSPRFSGLCDAGIIECDGQTYLMSVMTSAPDSSAHRAQVISIIEELFKLR